MRNKFFLSVICCLLFVYAVSAQILDSTLASYSATYQVEQCYLHYDKASYGPAETIWFKAYVKDGMYAAERSKTLYVDWVDEKGNLLQHTLSPIVAGGTTNGQFDIPANYNGSVISVHAYTKWMLNFDTVFLYKKDLRIIQPGGKPETAPALIPSLQFYPEGGDMISGIRNKVGFKAQDQWGRPVVLQGVIQKNGTAIDSLKFIHDGMGFFFLSPEEGARYTARWKDAKDIEHTTALPDPKAEGVSLQISFVGGRRVFTVECSPGIADQQKILHLIGTMQQTLVLKADVNLKQNNPKSGVLPLETLSSGVLNLTLFDDQWNALAERVIHVNNGEYFFPLHATVKTLGLSKRGKNEIELTVPDSIPASLSVSITDGAVETESADHIVSRFLLTGELRGSIYHPSYYFKNRSDSLAQKLDLVMLTNGWRRFKWDEIVKGKFPPITYPKDTTYLSLTGKLAGLTSAQLQDGGMMMLMSRGKTDSITKSIIADLQKDGSFRTNFIFFDSLSVYYQLPKKITKAKVDFMHSRLDALTYSRNNWVTPFLPDVIEHAQSTQLYQEVAAMKSKGMLAEVTVTARRKSALEVLDEKYTHGLFTGGDARQFDLLNDPVSYAYTDALEFLQGKVAGLQILRTITAEGEPTYRINWRGGVPIVYIDEMPADGRELLALPGGSIAYIKVFRPPFLGVRGYQGDPANGAIAIYTKRGGDGFDQYKEPTLPRQMVVGYSPVREYSSPDYATVSGNEKTDVRTTLLWNPELRTYKDSNKVLLSFYNSDLYSTSLRITVEGMDHDGRVTYYQEVIR